MTALSRFGLSVTLPRGWEAAIFRRRAHEGEETRPVMHVASFPLPARRGDYGSGAVDVMGPGDVFVALLEGHPDSSRAALYAGRTMPPFLGAHEFSPTTLQRVIPGHAGAQRFFTEAGRAFCLYVVLGSSARARLAADVNAVLPAIAIGAR